MTDKKLLNFFTFSIYSVVITYCVHFDCTGQPAQLGLETSTIFSVMPKYWVHLSGLRGQI